MSYAKLIRALVDAPMTVAELAEETGYHVVTVRAYLKALKKESLTYIADWVADKTGRRNTPMYAFGTKKDAPRKPECRAASMRRRRSRNAQAALLGVINDRP